MQRHLHHLKLPLLGLLCLLSACGFALRGTGGTSVPESWKQMYLSTRNPNSELSRELQRSFSAQDIVWVERESNLTIELLIPNIENE